MLIINSAEDVHAQPRALVFQNRRDTDVELLRHAGHCASSLIGEVIPTIAGWIATNVKALVYVDAFIPDVGENIFELAGAGSELGSALQFQGYPPFRQNDVEARNKPEMFHDVFAADLSARTADAMAAAQSPLALAAGEETNQAAAWKTIRSWDVIGLADKAITPEQQLFMAHRANAQITEIPGRRTSP
jgi:hypothetical protein